MRPEYGWAGYMAGAVLTLMAIACVVVMAWATRPAGTRRRHRLGPWWRCRLCWRHPLRARRLVRKGADVFQKGSR